MPTFFLLLPSLILENKEMKKCRDRKRVMNGLMPCDSTKSSLLAVMLLICLNLSHCNVAPTWERRIGCNCCLWGAAGSSQPPDMRAVSTGAGGRRSPSCLDLLLVTLSKKLVRDEFPAKRDDAWQTCAHSSSARFRLSAVLVEGRRPRRVWWSSAERAR